MLKVNGISYGWGDVDIKIPGVNLVLQEISYDDEQEAEESYGKGNRPRENENMCQLKSSKLSAVVMGWTLVHRGAKAASTVA